MKRYGSVFTIFLLCAAPAMASGTLQQARELHYQMGTYLELTIWHPEPEVAKRLIRDSVQEVHRLEEILSNFDPESAVSRFNEQAGSGKIQLDPDLFRLLRTARRFSALTDGYFDVTVGPLMELWRETASRGILPDRNTLMTTLRQVGYQKLKLYDDGEARLLRPGMKIDLGGIGKGYAVDRVVERLRAARVNAALINFGGSSIYAIGTPPGEQGWPIGIQGTEGLLRGVIWLRDVALSTSGSMGHFWTIGAKKYGHLINPRNGLASSEPRMATVISPTATAGEALTKPLVLLGKNAFFAVKRSPQAEALVISEKGPLLFSTGFRSKGRWQEAPSS
jgi:thiamine biosynthesis lipoprotein